MFRVTSLIYGVNDVGPCSNVKARRAGAHMNLGFIRAEALLHKSGAGPKERVAIKFAIDCTTRRQVP
jgi:hypothetical protein